MFKIFVQEAVKAMLSLDDPRWAEALPLLAETLVWPHGPTETRYLLAAAAALMGHKKLADVLNHLDCICQECPKCGECVYPDELQAAS
jgi:hypothetical protein